MNTKNLNDYEFIITKRWLKGIFACDESIELFDNYLKAQQKRRGNKGKKEKGVVVTKSILRKIHRHNPGWLNFLCWTVNHRDSHPGITETYLENLGLSDIHFQFEFLYDYWNRLMFAIINDPKAKI